MQTEKNIVDVNFEVLIEDKIEKGIEKIYEKHEMRYLFLPEIIKLSEYFGFTIRCANKWLTLENISKDSWYGIVVLEK